MTGVNGIDMSMPHDTVAEQAILGSMLQSAEATPAAMQIVRGRDLYSTVHQDVFNAIVTMYTSGDTVGDPVIISTRLLELGLIARLPDASYLHTCMQAVPTVANVTHYARIVAGHAESRRLIEAGTRITNIGRTPQITNKAAASAKALSDACVGTHGTTAVRVGDTLAEVLKEMDEGRKPGPSTGFSDLDRLLYGLNPGLIVIAGRPGMGKSTVGMDVARAMAIHQGIPTLFFALEMGTKQLNMRIIAAESGVSHRSIREGGDALTEQDWKRVTAAAPRIAAAPLEVDDQSGLTIHEICARSRIRAARGGLGCVIVDHIGLCDSVLGSRSSRTEEIGAITKGLHALSKDLGIPVIAVSQLNRGPEGRTDKRPQLSDLRESGNIEQDATVVIMVHRDDYYDKESPRAGEADFIVAKNRDGEMDTITVAAQLHYARFKDMAVV
jgi:replicative DNA helicase